MHRFVPASGPESGWPFFSAKAVLFRNHFYPDKRRGVSLVGERQDSGRCLIPLDVGICEGDEAAEAGFVPPDWLRHHDLQALVSSGALRRNLVKRRTGCLDQSSEGSILSCKGGGRLQVFEHRHGGRRPLVIGIHGWQGCHDATYMRSAAGALYEAGFDVARLNLRDHGRSAHLNEEMFHCCLLEEVADAVRQLVERSGDVPTGLFGFSLGGNFALRVAASQEGALLEKVIALCPVLDPAATLQAMDGGRWFYRWWFLNKWKKALVAKKLAFPQRYEELGEVILENSLTGVTDQLVRKYLAFPDLDSYLRGYSVVHGGLESLRAATRILLSEDDPLVPIASHVGLPKSPLLQVDISDYGGHCGFLTDRRLYSWQDSYLLTYFGSLKKRLMRSSPHRSGKARHGSQSPRGEKAAAQ